MLVIVLTICGLIFNVVSESCYNHRCLGCRPEMEFHLGTRQGCHPENWVSPKWIHNLGHDIHPSTGSRVPIEYRCLKMVATPEDPSSTRTVDVIRGCVPRVQEDSVCKALEAVERARGHSNVRCFTCWGDDCNGAPRRSPAHALLSVLLLLINAFLCYNVYR